jgi:hypothetical protein
MPLLPIEKTRTLVYGSDDGGATVRATSPQFNEIMRQVRRVRSANASPTAPLPTVAQAANELHLRSHIVNGAELHTGAHGGTHACMRTRR